MVMVKKGTVFFCKLLVTVVTYAYNKEKSVLIILFLL